MILNATGIFSARLYIIDNEISMLEVWDNEIHPMDNKSRPTSEWGEEYLTNTYSNDLGMLRKDLDMPESGNYQIVLRARMNGYGPDYNGEYDEDWMVLDVMYEEIPHDYAADFMNQYQFLYIEHLENQFGDGI